MGTVHMPLIQSGRMAEAAAAELGGVIARAQGLGIAMDMEGLLKFMDDNPDHVLTRETTKGFMTVTTATQDECGVRTVLHKDDRDGVAVGGPLRSDTSSEADAARAPGARQEQEGMNTVDARRQNKPPMSAGIKPTPYPH